MGTLLKKCIKCEKYTLQKNHCPFCQNPVRTPHPAKFSIDDRYSEYRLKMIRFKTDRAK